MGQRLPLAAFFLFFVAACPITFSLRLQGQESPVQHICGLRNSSQPDCLQRLRTALESASKFEGVTVLLPPRATANTEQLALPAVSQLLLHAVRPCYLLPAVERSGEGQETAGRRPLAVNSASGEFLLQVVNICTEVQALQARVTDARSQPFFDIQLQRAKRRCQRVMVDWPSCFSAEAYKRPYMLFISAGNHSILPSQVLNCPKRNFDVWVANYGAPAFHEHHNARDTHIFNNMKGGKFQNLHSLGQAHAAALQKYRHVAVWDDDITASCASISQLFTVVSVFDFWVAQPSFDNTSKINHDINRHNASLFLSWVSFVEMNTPVFRTDKLMAVLEHPLMDGSLYGAGTDYLYHWILGQGHWAEYGVVHRWPCRNPHDKEKPGGVREITKLASDSVRDAQWKDYFKKHHVTPSPVLKYAEVLSS